MQEVCLCWHLVLILKKILLYQQAKNVRVFIYLNSDTLDIKKVMRLTNK